MLFLQRVRWFAAFSLYMSGWAVLPATSQRPLVDEFAGMYTLLRDQSEDPKQAIDRATGTMSFFVRPIARRQLRQKTETYHSFSLQRSGEFLNTRLPSEPVLSLPLSGSTVLWKSPDGEMVRVHLQPGPELVQVFETKQGRREDRFTLSPDHRLLTISVKVTSNQLPKPVEYRMVYRRA